LRRIAGALALLAAITPLASIHNLELWVGIQTMVKVGSTPLSSGIRTNLRKLGDFVISTTFQHGCHMPDHTMNR
jgi:hypothetical protein